MSSDSFENFAISAGSTVPPGFVANFAASSAGWPWMNAPAPYRAVMWLRKSSGDAMVLMVSAPSPTPRTVTSP